MNVINKIIVICVAILLTLIVVIVLGRGGMEPEVAIIPALNTPALLLRLMMPIWAIPLVLITLFAVIIKVLKKSDATSNTDSTKGA
jgi:TRAP-type C4-dicarboxylate transport system permease small subunit